MTVNLSRLITVGGAKETTQGTPVSVPTFWLPVSTFKPEDLIEEVKDTSFVGNPTVVRGIYAGVKDATVDFDGPSYVDVIGNLFAALGLADTISGAGPYTHTMKLTTAQPPSYTFLHYDVYESRVWPGCVLDQLDLKIDTKGMVTYQSKWKGWPSSTASNGTPAFTTATPFLPYQGAVTFAGGSDANLLSGSISLKRSVEAIHTINGVQTPTVVFAGGFEVSAKLDFIFSTNTEMNYFRAYAAANPLNLLLTQSANDSLSLNFNAPVATKSMTDDSKAFLTCSVDIEGVYNTTDAGPFSVVLKNQQATAY
jgi:hypothetical protein